MFFWTYLAFCMIQQMLAILSLVPLPSFKSTLYIWKFTVHVLLKRSLKDFECYSASMWNECNCAVVWTFLALPFFGVGMKTDLFQSCGHCCVFHIWCHIECSTFTASFFRIWNSSAGIPSPPLALFLGMLPKAHLTLHSRMAGSRWVSTPSWLFVSLRSFLCSSSVYSCHLFLGQGPLRQAIIHDYNNKSNVKQVKETVPTWIQNWLFPATQNGS